ncbi:magnesium transporter [Candidatus Dependentiae bacterium]
MSRENLLSKIRDNLQTVIKRDSTLGESLWKEFLELHPVDIADFLESLDKESSTQILSDLPRELRDEVFGESSVPEQSEVLKLLPESQKVEVLRSLGTDELTDLFDYMSDEDLKKNLKLLHKKEREKVISLLKFDPESVGGIMEVDVLSFMQDFTVDKSVKILQRLRPRQEIHREIYVTDDKHKLVGHIKLEDLVMHSPKARLVSFMHKNELVAQTHQDREEIANKMVHYGLMTVPVVGKDNYFLGVIPSDTLVEVIVKEATEDAQKMAALSPMKHTYFETPFWKILYQRGNILVVLLLAESMSTTILASYEGSMPIYLIVFITMLMSTGGNTSHQTSTLVIQGMASGEIHQGNVMRFIKREMLTAIGLALLVGSAAFARAWYTTRKLDASFAVALTVGVIVLTAVILGSLIPLGLKKLKIDPAFSAGPFLATLMDIVGVAIFCVIVKMIVYS